MFMVRQRVVLGAIGDGEGARKAARRLRDEGREVVYVGGDQTPEQLVRTLIAEDAATIMVDGDAESVARIVQLCAELGAGDVSVTPLGVPPGGPRSP
jgi:methylmalonyl-CoA mutase cobalamin-binding domain/chain